MKDLSMARGEASWRIERVTKQTPNTDETVMQHFMEFAEVFQQTIVHQFRPSLLIMSTSDVRYASVGLDSDTYKALMPSHGRAFYHRLFDFQTLPKQSLQSLLEEATAGKPLQGTTIVLASARTPREFPEWFQAELVNIRASNIHMHVVVLLLAPALPCSWQKARILTGSAFDGSMFDTFRSQDTFFTPNCLTVMTVGPSPRKILKKVRAVTFFTGNHVAKLCDNQVVWRGGV